MDNWPELQKQHKLSRAMIIELRRLLKVGRARGGPGRTLRALASRGLVMYDSEDVYREAWSLTEAGLAVAKAIPPTQTPA